MDTRPISVDALIKSVGGLKGLNTTLQTAKATITELQNQISILNAQLLKKEQIIKDLENRPNPYTEEISLLKGQVDTLVIEKQDFAEKLAKCQSGQEIARDNLIKKVIDFIKALWPL